MKSVKSKSIYNENSSNKKMLMNNINDIISNKKMLMNDLSNFKNKNNNFVKVNKLNDK